MIKTFREFIADKLNNITINEMAFNKKKMEDKIEGLENQINLNLIKIIRYKDDINFNKHISDIMDWLSDIQDLDFNKKGRKFTKELYYKLLFEQPITDRYNIKYLSNKEKGKLRRYITLPKIRNEENTMRLLDDIHLEIADLLSKNEIFDIEFKLININRNI